jgi:hypothetical protein
VSTNKQTSKQTNKQTNEQTNKQTNKRLGAEETCLAAGELNALVAHHRVITLLKVRDEIVRISKLRRILDALLS